MKQVTIILGIIALQWVCQSVACILFRIPLLKISFLDKNLKYIIYLLLTEWQSTLA